MVAGRIQAGMDEFSESQTVSTKPDFARAHLRLYGQKNWCSVAVGCGPLPRTQNKHGVVVALKKAGAIEYSEHICLHEVLQKNSPCIALHAWSPAKIMIRGCGQVKEVNLNHRRL